ncbi:MAG: TlpA family protein disulfide reductase [Stenotrophomonas sp.]|uniref:TlpA family protein disulfide reductase n=1 Tax=Stenotrophomonas sp. TaxID=69392 RepID=UPI003D6CAC61
MIRKLLPFALLGLLLAGCKPAAPTATPEPAPTTPPQATEPAAAEQPGVVQQTAEMPQLKVQTVDGKAYDLASHRGQWVVINFWATWCAPCLQEMPELSALHAMRSNVEVIGLAYEDIELDEMQTFLKEHPVAYPIAIVDTYRPPSDFATPRGLPMTYLIAPDGKVAKQFLGPVNAHDIEQAIAAAGGKAA